MDSGVQLPTTLPFQPSQADSPVGARFERGAQVLAPAPMEEPIARKSAAFTALGAGLMIMLAQLFVAVVLMAPEGPLSYRYETLVQHDSYWFANIIDRGYQTILPPITRKMMEVSNVAFFPAYPVIAGALHHWVGLSVNNALLITAQAAAWGFWTYFFLFCARWKVSPVLQFFGATAIAAHPTAFFLIAAYSESLFLMGLMGFMYWTTAKGRTAKVLAALHGIVMSATRIVGCRWRSTRWSGVSSPKAGPVSWTCEGGFAAIHQRSRSRSWRCSAASDSSFTASTAGAAGTSTCRRRSLAGLCARITWPSSN
jgi:hypothetical protein